MHGQRSRRSLPTTASSGPRPSPRSPTTLRRCSPSSTIPPSTSCTCAPPIPSRAHSPRSGPGPGSPRGRAPGTRGWRWCSSCCRLPRAAGGRSTARTWSRWSEPARGSRPASCSNDPPTRGSGGGRMTHQAPSTPAATTTPGRLGLRVLGCAGGYPGAGSACSGYLLEAAG
jgi:hypothetical protein